MSALTIETDRIVMVGDWAREIILDITYSGTENIDEFNKDFQVIGGTHLSADNDFYQGISVNAVIQRKSDGRLFGYAYWDDISKHGESYIEANGDEHGFDYDTYVWLPVEPFTIASYRFPAVAA